MITYALYGVDLEIDAELPLPRSERAANIQMVWEWYRPPEPPDAVVLHKAWDPVAETELLLVANGSSCHVTYGGNVFVFDHLDPTAPIAWWTAASGVSLHFALERVLLPIYLIIAHNEVALHASAVEIGNKAWILAGPSGAGKSTACWGLLATGGRVLADDLVMIDAADRARPAAGGLRLDKDADSVSEADVDLAIAGEHTKRWFRMQPQWRAPNIPQTIGAIFVLGSAPTTATERMTAPRALEQLLAASYRLTEAPSALRKHRLERLAHLAETTTIYQLPAYPSASALRELVDRHT